ncbi:hypothetical protein Mp_4g09730 [Marchantia polymorpha subsp. ruderalis]|nr:hypothetical protein MARPO_0132s0016 [Marchantia polymorpha]BBN08210.1 hypothetical protein Mp_4g09730 [Marchantia polymorpha subsp. ruderalis]|eukprot:PTQ29940.1 hypothetical protein MARPO_0132s0016 [Marchantia polymorpha]
MRKRRVGGEEEDGEEEEEEGGGGEGEGEGEVGVEVAGAEGGGGAGLGVGALDEVDGGGVAPRGVEDDGMMAMSQEEEIVGGGAVAAGVGVGVVVASAGGGGVAPGPPSAGAGGNNINSNNSSKRARSDAAEWSEAAITALLDAFGARYIASHRGNLRGKDWADVTRAVNARGVTGNKSVEQCRNKIDNLKKRFKLEREKGTPSAWPWFRTLDAIVGRAPKRAGIPGGIDGGHRSDPDIKLSLPTDVLLPPPQPPPPPHPPPMLALQAVAPVPDDSDPDNVAETPYSSQRDSHTDFPTFKGTGKDVMSEMTNPNPKANSNAVPNGPGKLNRKKRKNVCQAGKDVAASIASFAEVFAKIEFAKMELFKDMELRRLEMQYKLAKLAHTSKKGRTNSVSSNSE